MKGLLLSFFYFLTIISCRKHLSQPTEQEVKNAFADWNYTKFLIYPYPEGPFYPGFPSKIKNINVIEINRKKRSRNFFIAKIVVEGMLHPAVIPAREFIDTIQLELREIEKIWVIENMKHQIKYLGNYNSVDTHF